MILQSWNKMNKDQLYFLFLAKTASKTCASLQHTISSKKLGGVRRGLGQLIMVVHTLHSLLMRCFQPWD
jgi:hypothetical protein